MNKEIPKDFYITSDTWFGRPQILQIANRAFNDIEEMNSTLIKNWNKKVKNTDVVFHLGNFAEERFKDIFRSERYSKVMNYLASPYFNAQTMMGTLPIQHYVSEALDNHVKGIAKIAKPSGKEPLHVNFV